MRIHRSKRQTLVSLNKIRSNDMMLKCVKMYQIENIFGFCCLYCFLCIYIYFSKNGFGCFILFLIFIIIFLKQEDKMDLVVLYCFWNIYINFSKIQRTEWIQVSYIVFWVMYIYFSKIKRTKRIWLFFILFLGYLFVFLKIKSRNYTIDGV